MLGDALLATGVITQGQLDRALAEQRVSGALLGETLTALKFVTDDALSRALAHQAGVSFVNVVGKTPDPAAVALVPEPFARKHLLAPLGVTDLVLQVVQANPFDVLSLDVLRQHAARPVAVTCATADGVRTLLDRAYRGPDQHAPDDRRDEAATNDATDLHIEPEADGVRVRALPELGLSRKDLATVTELLERSRGLLVVTGPRASGTTSTLYAMLAHLRNGSKNIVTLDDPTAMRSVLRQYPDVVMIGEMRDAGTAQMALWAALSGVLVLGALPTDDAASAVPRLTDFGLEPYLLSATLVGIVGQRLIRLVCPECREPVAYPPEMLRKVGLTGDPEISFRRGKGCAHCRGTGYRGRTGVFEILTVSSDSAALIRDGADAQSIKQAAVTRGMKTLFDDALAKAICQQTTLEEVLRVTRG